MITLVVAGSATWTSADTFPASYEVYGGFYDVLVPANLRTLSGTWSSASATGPRGVMVTFGITVTIKRFSGLYLNFPRRNSKPIIQIDK